MKGHTSYHRISVTDDYTLAERELINQYRQEAQKKNAREENENYYFAVRGSPRTGISLKKDHQAKEGNKHDLICN